MKNIGLTLALLFAITRTACAQVSVEVLMDQEQFLPDEAVPVKVRLINNSGQTLSFGQEDWLRYSVEMRDGPIVLKTGDPKVPHDFQVKGAEMATSHSDLGPCFDLSKPGRYAVTATVHIRDWNREFTSEPVVFNIIKGVKFWEQEFGVPQASATSEPEVRKYILEESMLVKRMNLYVRVTDASESKSFRVVCLGPTISFSNPQTRLDPQSNLHLVYQEAAQRYRYFVISSNGGILARQTYIYVDSAPHLDADASGKPVIMGGLRQLADNDLPTATPANTNATAPSVP